MTANGDGVTLSSGPKLVRDLPSPDHDGHDEIFGVAAESSTETRPIIFGEGSSGNFL